MKVTPMQPLSSIVDHVAKMNGLKLDAAACTLLHKGKALDLATPIRFANLPSGVTLELQTGMATFLVVTVRGPARRAVLCPKGRTLPRS